MKEKNILDDKGEYLPVMEYFLSLQGEGFYTGTASFFIRIGGCDVGCHWCDVKESWDPERHPLSNIDTIINQIPNHIKIVVITGGEPTLYNLNYLTEQLHKKGKQVHLETSGTGSVSGLFDWVCLSPKKNESPKEEFYGLADELKMIIFNQTDFDFAEKQANMLGRGSCELYLQPEWSQRKKMIPLIINYIQQHPKWKISLQTHKHLNIP
jgi:organic radical activating enzyme